MQSQATFLFIVSYTEKKREIYSLKFRYYSRKYVEILLHLFYELCIMYEQILRVPTCIFFFLFVSPEYLTAFGVKLYNVHFKRYVQRE